LVACVLEGVSTHLESALQPVRLEGMRVAEAFATVMGQPLRFDELDGLREEEEEVGANAALDGGAKEEEGGSALVAGSEWVICEVLVC
jgi:hypothetical protein